jgi:hypothetical protein
MGRLFVLGLFAFLLMGMFQSCGPVPDKGYPCCSKPTASSDPAFDRYVNEFEYYSKRNAKDIPIYFSTKLPSNIAGLCHYYRIGKGPIIWGYVEIDKANWLATTEYQRINLIFHELGHCVLGRDHMPWGDYMMACPSSFMYRAVLSTECIENNYENYLHELFPEWVK